MIAAVSTNIRIQFPSSSARPIFKYIEDEKCSLEIGIDFLRDEFKLDMRIKIGEKRTFIGNIPEWKINVTTIN